MAQILLSATVVVSATSRAIRKLQPEQNQICSSWAREEAMLEEILKAANWAIENSFALPNVALTLGELHLIEPYL